MVKQIGRFFREDDPYRVMVLAILTAIVLFSGLFSIVTRQPSTWFDEEIHYVRSIQLANGDILVTQDGDPTKYGGMISDTQNTFTERSFSSKLFDPEIQAIEGNWEEDYSDLPYSEEQVYRVSVTAASYMPISYTPYILAVWVNKGLQLSVAKEFMLMKLFGFLSSFIMLLLAVRFLPFAKVSLLALATLPPYFLSMTSVTADSYLFGVAPLFIAYAVSVFYRLDRGKILDTKHIGVLIFLAFLVTVAKPPTCFLVALLIPIIVKGRRSKRLTPRQSLSLVLTIVLLAILTFAWLYLVRHVDGTKYFNTTASVGDQLNFMMANPVEFLKIFAYNLLNYHFFDLQLGYADHPNYMSLPMLSELMAGIGLALSVFIGSSNNSKQRYGLVGLFNGFKVLLFVAITLLIFLVLYIQFTPVASPIIEGVQPRYFLPFWLLLLTIRTKETVSSKLGQGLIVLSCLMPVMVYHLFILIQL